MKKVRAFLCVGVLVGCQQHAQRNDHLREHDPIRRVLAPITLEQGQTTIQLADILPAPLVVTAVSMEGQQLALSADRSCVVFANPKTLRPLEVLKLRTNGLTYDVIVRKPRVFDPQFTAVNRAQRPQLRTQSYHSDSVTITTSEPTDHLIALWQNVRLPLVSRADALVVAIPQQAKDFERSYLRVFASNAAGDGNDLLIPLVRGQVVQDVSSLNHSDLPNLVLYFLMVDRFVDGDPSNTKKVADRRVLPKANYFGGDLAGVLQTIGDGYFADLGVNALWLSPLVENPQGAYREWPEPRRWYSGYHGYWPISDNVDPRFGSAELLRSVVATAHHQDMAFFVDLISNHVHEENPLYRQHPDWFGSILLENGNKNIRIWDPPLGITTWFDTFLPDINYDNPAALQFFTDQAVSWVTRYDIDGFRHDAVKHVPPVFWKTLTRKLRSQIELARGKYIYQLGETFGNRQLVLSYVGQGQLDAEFDFPLYFDAVRLLLNSEPLTRLADSIYASLDVSGWHHLMGNISGNHDLTRFISLAGGDVSPDEDAKEAGWKRKIGVKNPIGYAKLLQLLALQLSIPGVPVIYYGDEFGMPGAGDPDNRRWMRFGNQLTERERGNLAVTKRLIALRRHLLPLIYGECEVLAEQDSLAIVRHYFGAVTVTVINRSQRPATIAVVLPDGVDLSRLTAEFGGALQRDHHSGRIVVTVAPNGIEVVH